MSLEENFKLWMRMQLADTLIKAQDDLAGPQ